MSPSSVQRVSPQPGQESVWDYPRPPAVVPSDRLVQVRSGELMIAESRRAVRVLETSHPPTWYLPPADVRPDVLRRSAASGTVCEWKGGATYWDLAVESGVWLTAAAWSYESPRRGFESLTGFLSFYPSRLDCRIAGERVRPQAGGFYGGWITDDVVGPFKGEAGTRGW